MCAAMKLRLRTLALSGLFALYSCETLAGVSAPSNQAIVTTLASSSSSDAGNAVAEWYGPFSSWTNVTAFGAKCDGVTDDSVAVSNALAAIGNGHCSPVLLIPGMCRVTKKPWLSQR